MVEEPRPDSWAARGRFVTIDGNTGDRNNLTLWGSGDRLINNVTQYNNNTIVVLRRERHRRQQRQHSHQHNDHSKFMHTNLLVGT